LDSKKSEAVLRDPYTGQETMVPLWTLPNPHSESSVFTSARCTDKIDRLSVEDGPLANVCI